MIEKLHYIVRSKSTLNSSNSNFNYSLYAFIEFIPINQQTGFILYQKRIALHKILSSTVWLLVSISNQKLFADHSQVIIFSAQFLFEINELPLYSQSKHSRYKFGTDLELIVFETNQCAANLIAYDLQLPSFRCSLYKFY